MRKTMRAFMRALAIAITLVTLLSLTPTAAAQQPRPRVVIINRVPVFDPFFAYPFGYPYPPNYVERNYGYVKLDTHRKDVSLYVDGGYADKIEKNKKIALRPGNHDIELRDSDGRQIFQERVAVMVGKTTKLEIPS